MSAEAWHEAAEPLRVAYNAVEVKVNQALGQISLTSDVREWNLIIILLREDHSDYSEVQKYDRKRKVFEFRLKISYREFMNSGALAQQGLILDSLLRSTRLMEPLGLRHDDQERLQALLLRLKSATLAN